MAIKVTADNDDDFTDREDKDFTFVQNNLFRAGKKGLPLPIIG